MERAVTIIGTNGASALVEWQEAGRQQRAWLPAITVVDGRCDSEELARAIPVGVDWTEYISEFGPADIANQLTRRGIWTKADFKARLPDAKAALWELCGQALAGILRAIEHEEAKK